jgi:hypothetical protein
MIRARIEIAVLLLLLTGVAPGFGADNSPDTIAKFLAGLAVPAASATSNDQSSQVIDQPNAASLATPQQSAPPPSPTPTSTRRRPGSLIPERQPHVAPSPTVSESNRQSDASAARTSTTASPVADSPRRASDPWIIHSTELDRAWKHTEQAQLAAISNWAPNELGQSYRTNGTMYYMFSGPDFLYAHAFFPNARTYVLCGNEPVGAIPDLNKISVQALPVALANIRKSLESVLSWSFFITKNMKTDLTQTQLSGTLPLLYIFLARAGCTIDSVTPVAIDNTGNLSDGEKTGDTPGVRIVFTGSLAQNRLTGIGSSTLYYFSSDLSDDGIKSRPGFLRFCERQGHGVSLLKAASYLMHEPGFSHVRQFLLGASDTILQDDSGIPFRYFEPPMWDIHYFGPYHGPIEVFKKYWQQDLANECARAASSRTVSELPFGFGYEWQPKTSGLIIATRRPTSALSVGR